MKICRVCSFQGDDALFVKDENCCKKCNNLYLRTWHIDHIIPQSKLPFSSMEDENFKRCWALNNLRPLDAKENLKKGNKLL